MPPQPAAPLPIDQALALLQWQIEMGADEAIGEIAADHLAQPTPHPASPPPAEDGDRIARESAAPALAARPAPQPRQIFQPAAATPPRALTESAAEPVL